MSQANNSSGTAENKQQEEAQKNLDTSESTESLEMLSNIQLAENADETEWICCPDPNKAKISKFKYEALEKRCDSLEKYSENFNELCPREDLENWSLLEDSTKGCIKSLLVCYALSNKGYKEFTEHIKGIVQIPVLLRFYNTQIASEAAHGETCLTFLNTFIQNKEELNMLFEKVKAERGTTEKMAWLQAWTTDSTVSFAEKLVVLLTIKCIFICSICKLAQHVGCYETMFMLRSFTIFLNSDTKTHYSFASYVFPLNSHLPSKDRIKQIICEAVTIEQQFLAPVLPQADMDDITKFLQYVADQLLKVLGCPVHYNQSYSFDHCSSDLVMGLESFFCF